MTLPWYSMRRWQKREYDNNEPQVGEGYDGPHHRRYFS